MPVGVKSKRAFLDVCRSDPNAFIAYVFGVNPCVLHREMQHAISSHLDVTICVPRNHGKTVQVTLGRSAWDIGRNPNIRIPIVQNTLPDARKSVRALRGILESDRYHEVFPEIEPDQADWGDDGFTVKRNKVGLRDPTVSANGIFGHAGQRADKLIFDDIEDLDNSIRQPAKREQVKEAVVNTWYPTLEPGGSCVRAFTPWHVSGQAWEWKQMAEKGDMDTFLLYRPCRGVERSPWPEKFPAPELVRWKQKLGSIAYSRAFELQPLSGDEVVFREGDLIAAARKSKPAGTRGRRYLALDMAFSEEDQKLTTRSASNKDPDWSVLMAADIDEAGHVWVVKIARGKWTFPKFLDEVVKFCGIHHVSQVLAEANGPQKGLVQMVRHKLTPLGVGVKNLDRNTDKYARACEVQTVVEEGRFHLRCNDAGEILHDQQIALEELSQFPVGAKDDVVDASVDLMHEAKIKMNEPRRPPTVVDPFSMVDLERFAVPPSGEADDERRWNGWAEGEW